MAISTLATGGAARGQGSAGWKRRPEGTPSTLVVGRLIAGMDMASMKTR